MGDRDPLARFDRLADNIEEQNRLSKEYLQQHRESQRRMEALLTDQTAATKQVAETNERVVEGLGVVAQAVTQGFGEVRQDVQGLRQDIKRLEDKVDGKAQIGASPSPLALTAGSNRSSERRYHKELTSKQDILDQMRHRGETPEERVERLALQGFKPHHPK